MSTGRALEGNEAVRAGEKPTDDVPAWSLRTSIPFLRLRKKLGMAVFACQPGAGR